MNTPQDNPPKIAYEWVLVMGKGEDIILSENQYAVYKKHTQSENPGMIFYGDIAVNPFYVAQTIKRKAQYIKEKYPCKTCYSTGRKPDNTGWCENCKGSGVDLSK